jgi:phytanoyl-CoA hydroxylase
MPDFNSRFKGFWTDHVDAEEHLEQMRTAGQVTLQEAEQLLHFIRDGYVVIPNAISTQLADQIAHEMANVHQNAENFVARTERQNYSYASKEVTQSRFVRLIDYYVNSSLAREAIFSPAIARILQLIFERQVMAFQSLSFNVGSQQAIHQDGAYVVLSEPVQFAASWIALEDVQEGTGELIYYPGSHRYPDFLFSDEYKHWKPARDGEEQLQASLKNLHEQAKRMNLSLKSFLPKKGDALIWAADLAHGGSSITNPNATRKSLVTHYCPADVLPNYAKETNIFYKKESIYPDCHYSARHYDLRPTAPSINTKNLLKLAPDIIRQIEKAATHKDESSNSGTKN